MRPRLATFVVLLCHFTARGDLPEETCDADEVAALFSKLGLTEQALAETTQVHWAGKGLTDDDMRVFGAWLQSSGGLSKLETLHIGGNEFGAVGTKSLATAISAGLLGSVERISLGGARIGDAGLKTLASSLGALPRLSSLALYSCRIGDAGVKALADAASFGALAKLQTLSLRRNFVDDAGVVALATACESLPQLTNLVLTPNDYVVSEAGAGKAALAAACASGRCPAFCSPEPQPASTTPAR